MARPKTKQGLLDLSIQNYHKLVDFISVMNLNVQNRDFPPGTMNRNIRDVLMHIHHWHLMMLNWYKTGMSGEKPEMPAKGYTWKTTPEFNKWILERYSQTSLDEAKESLTSSFSKIRKIIDSHSDEELFEKKRYKWTGSTSLGAYLVSATSSHYEWALKLIKKAKN